MALVPGTHLGPYEILAPLGAGGMGEVYRAKDPRLGRQVAIKILPPDLLESRDRVKRFETEARAASALNHPNLITIYEIGTVDSIAYIAMELVDGRTFRELLHSGTQPLRKILTFAAQLADGLAKAHSAGIIHRDLKPENLMITRDGLVKILDFGLAKLIPGDTEEVGKAETQTRTGTIRGTVPYMSPEQAAGQKVDFRSDQFSFGIILYELITGKHPFHRKNMAEILSAILNDEPPPLSSITREIPAPLRWTIERCLAKDPRDRYESTRDLAKEMQAWKDHFAQTASSSELDIVQRSAERRRIQKLWNISSAVLIVAFVSTLIFLIAKKYDRVNQSLQTLHRLSYRRGYVSSAKFTPDGKTIVYSGSFGSNQRDLFLTRGDGVESRSLGIPDAEILSISSTGNMAILLNKWGSREGILAEVPLAGGAPHELADRVWGASWSPDSVLVIARRIDGQSRIEYPLGKVLYHTTSYIGSPNVSPRGDLIAFFERPFAGDANGIIKIIDLQGRTKAKTQQNLYPTGFAWSIPDNELFWSTWGLQPGSGSEIHSLNSQDESRLIQRFMPSQLYDVGPEREILLNLDQARTETVGLVSGSPQALDLSWLDSSTVAGLSEDGKKVLIYERGHGSEAPAGTLYIRNTDGSPAVRLGASAAAALSRDGKYALGWLIEPFRLLLIPTGPGETTTFRMEQFADMGGYDPRWYFADFLANGTEILFVANQPGRPGRAYIQNINGGPPRAVMPENLIPDLVSRDGKWAVGRNNGKYFLYSIDSKVMRTLKGVDDGEIPIQWSLDGMAVYTFTPDMLPGNIYRVRLSDGQRTLIKSLMPLDISGVTGIGPVFMTPDEKTIVYSYRSLSSSLYLVSPSDS